ncbi:MAG: glycosyltransferase [Algisphaera sp.]
MSSLPRLTVIIPNLNQGLYLERAICSVLDQGYDNLELIVMDGGSTDESLEIIAAYEDDIAHWQSQWDSGPAEAINTAISWATGDILSILDADDVYLPCALHDVAKTMNNADWAIGHAQRVDEDDHVLGELKADTSRGLAQHLLRDEAPACASATFYRTALIKAMGGFDSHLQLSYIYEMHCRLQASGETPALIPVSVAAIRDHAESLTATHALSCGHEFVDAAERYASQLPPTQRYLLWRSCDERRRIYSAATAETRDNPERRTLWNQLLRRPWWLTRDDYRRKVLAAIGSPTSETAVLPHDEERRAA